MKIRTQLILAFLLLSVLPLSAIVLYSYFSSQRALRTGVQAENAMLAAEMDRTMSSIRTDLRQQLAALGNIPAEAFVNAARGEDSLDPRIGALLADVGRNSPFLESLEVVPAAPPAPGSRTARPAERTAHPEGAPSAPPAPSPDHAPHAPPPPPHPVATIPPIRIDMEEIRRSMAESGMTPQQAEALSGVVAPSIDFGMAVAGEVIRNIGSFENLAQLKELERMKGLENAGSAGESSEELERKIEEARRETEKISRIAQREAQRIIVRHQREISEEQKERLAEKRREGVLVLGSDVGSSLLSGDRAVGTIEPRISARRLLAQVLGGHRAHQGEIPFAVDSEGKLYTFDDEAAERLSELPLNELAGGGVPEEGLENWVIATSRDEESNLVFGIARPIDDSLQQMRKAAAKNFGYGLGMIGLALLGIVPLANHMSRDVVAVTEGAQRIAHGELDTELAVRSRGELGQLASAFNRMSRDLKEQKQRLLDEEQLRREQEIQQRLIEAEYARKSGELEEARRFQLSLLPQSIPEHPGLEIAVSMKTATEVGGDYYDFSSAPDGSMMVLIGDATGHGARAGTMVTVIKSLFASAGQIGSLPDFLRNSNEAVRRMNLGRMAMALALVRFHTGGLVLSSAGMPPVLIHRKSSDTVDELTAVGTPLGTMSCDYVELTASLSSGDTVLLMSDGFPELIGTDGEPLGYKAVEREFGNAAARADNSGEVVHALEELADAWTGGAPPDDDITFVVVRIA